MCKRSVQHKCLGENENDAWRGMLVGVPACVSACLCADPASAPPQPLQR